MRNKIGNLLWGLAFIAVGFGVAGNVFNLWSFNILFDGWWTLFIIIPCAISIIQKGFNTGNAIGLAVGILLLLNQQDIFPFEFGAKLFFPILLVIIGLAIIFKPAYTRDSYKSGSAGYDSTNAKNEGKTEYTVNSTEYEPGNKNWNTSCGNEILAIFCGNDGSFRDREFKGASCTAVFGGIELDLRGARIDRDVTINATAIFGGVEIFVDDKVQVVYRSVPIFGGIDCSVPPRDPSLPKVFINGVAVFGGIDIE